MRSKPLAEERCGEIGNDGTTANDDVSGKYRQGINSPITFQRNYFIRGGNKNDGDDDDGNDGGRFAAPPVSPPRCSSG